jgi:30S ribosomal protein S31
MGRGDRRTKKGKIFRGTFGKTRLKTKTAAAKTKDKAKAAKK